LLFDECPDGRAPVVTAADRLLLAALADRLIYGHPDTFSADDARELARLLPYTRRWHSFFTDWLPGFEGRVKVPGGSTAGFAAGVGHVSIKDGGRSIEVDSRGRSIVRAGQWKFVRWGHAVKIEQVMSGDMDDGRTAILAFYRDGKIELRLQVQGWLAIGPLRIGLARFRAWKVPA
jgi:hypothetical protein